MYHCLVGMEKAPDDVSDVASHVDDMSVVALPCICLRRMFMTRHVNTTAIMRSRVARVDPTAIPISWPSRVLSNGDPPEPSEIRYALIDPAFTV